MSMFENLGGVLKGALGQIEADALPVILSQVLAKTDLGSIGGLLGKLQEAGLDKQVSSWLGSGPNQPITMDQIKAALGNQQVQDLARQFGIPVDKLLAALSGQLPQLVDQLSPHGKLQEPHKA